MKPSISVIIKPTLDCNIECGHCYHTKDERTAERIGIDILDRLFGILSREYESVWFIWHGGEPLLMPFRFFRNAVELQEKHFGRGSGRFGNTIQTNGILLERKFIDFCMDKKINIGISYEGPYNDVLRERTDDVDRKISRLSSKERMFSVSSTISSGTVSKQKDLYELYRKERTSVSFFPVIPAGCAKCGKDVPDADEYIRHGIECFDQWLYDADAEIPLIPYYLYVLSALGEPSPSDCAHASCLTKWLCVYPNGDLYPCGKGCPADFRMCNISEIESMDDAFLTDGFANILEGTIERREKCMGCDVYGYCNGGCSIDAYYEKGIVNNGGDSCRIFKGIFGHVLSTVNGILETRPDLSRYNRFVKDAILGRLINPKVVSQ